MRNSKLRIIIGVISLIGVFVLFRVLMPTSNKIAAYRFPIEKSQSLDETLSRLEENLKRDSKSHIALNDLAMHFVIRAKRLGREDDYTTAEKYARESLNVLSQSNVGAKIALAKVQSAHHDFNGSITTLETALAEAPASAIQIFPELIQSYLGIGELTKASLIADQLVHARPSTFAFGLRALVQESQGRIEESYFDFKRALKVEDLGEAENSAWVRSLFARFLIRRNQFELAKDLLEESLRIHPDQPFAIGQRGDLELARGNLAAAGDYYNRAFRILKDTHFLLRMAEVKALQKDVNSAKELFLQVRGVVEGDLSEKKIGHRSDMINALLGLHSLGAANEDDLKIALDLALEEVKARPTAASLFTASNVFVASGRFAEALMSNLAILRTGARIAEYYNQTANIYSKLDNPDRDKFYQALVKEAQKLDK